MAPSTQACRLFSLPQELQDAIFDLAFANENGAKYMDPEEWRLRERSRRIKNHGHRVEPFPKPKVTQLLVSKRFFIFAARALVQSQSFGPHSWASEECYGTPENILSTGIIPAFVRELECSLEDTRRLPDDLPNLKKLVLNIGELTFLLMASKTVYFDEFEKEDFAELLRKEDWEKLLRLCNQVHVLEVKDGRRYPRRGQENPDDMLARNISKLTRYIHEVRQGKENEKGHSAQEAMSRDS